MTGAHGAMIREAAAPDLDSVLDLYPLLFEAPGAEPPDWDPRAARERAAATIADPTSTILLAETLGEGLIGLCSCYIDLVSIRYGRRCWVEDLVVAPPARSRGVGAHLLDQARAWAGEHGATHLELDSADLRLDAHRFYERENPAFSGRTFSWWLQHSSRWS